MSIASVPSPLQQILAASTYNAAWFSGSTIEAQIQAAINAAVNDGASYVFVPANMYPYHASLVTFNTNVLMLREGGMSGVVDLQAYGAFGDNTTIDDAAFAGALSYAAALANPTNLVYCPPGNYIVSIPVVLKEKTGLFGPGPRGAAIKAAVSGFTGAAIVTNDLPNTAQQHCYLEGLEINGNNAVAGTKGIYWNGVGQISYIRNVEVNNVAGFAIKLDSATGVFGQNNVALEDISITGTGDHCIILGVNSAGNILHNITVQNMPTGKAGIAIDGTGGPGNCQDHLIEGVHFECTAHGGIAVYVKNALGNTIRDVQGAGMTAADTMVKFDVGTSGNRASNISAGGVALKIIDDSTMNGITMTGVGLGLDVKVHEYLQTAGSSGRSWTFLGDRDKISVDRGDNTIGVSAGIDAPIQIFNTPFTSTHQCSLSTAGTYHGARFRIIRTLNATGLFPLQVQTDIPTQLRFLGPGQWVECYFDGSLWNVMETGYVAKYSPTLAIVSSGGAVQMDASLTDGFEIAALQEATTIGAPGHPTNGQQITHTIIQDGVGGHAVAWNGVFKNSWSDAGNTSNKRSSITHRYDGSNWNQVGAQTPYV